MNEEDKYKKYKDMFISKRKMIKLRKLIIGVQKDTKLYEGLIYSQSIGSTSDHIKNWTFVGIENKCNIKTENDKNKIHLNFYKNPTIEELDNLIKWLDLLKKY